MQIIIGLKFSNGIFVSQITISTAVDIALKNELTGGYGGILIRSIYDIDKRMLTKGPMVCAMKLFSGYNAFEQSIRTQIISHEFKASVIKKGPKKGLGQNATSNNAHKRNYSFTIDPSIMMTDS